MKRILYFILFTFICSPNFSQEICNNGIDDDLDGLVDLQDTADCFCSISKADSSTSSLIPNPSFEQRTCCPSAASQLNCVDNWIQATGATADYFNTCGILAVGTFPPPPLPLPNGNGYVGFFDNFGTLNLPYKEYVGTCLLDTLKAGVNYELDYSLANSFGNLTTEIAIYGTTDCANLPFGSLLNTPSSFCPTSVVPSDWTLLKIDTVTCLTSSWVRSSLNFTPTQNYTAIVIGGSCNNNSGSSYYYMDHLILKESGLFSPSLAINDTGNYCQNNLVLEAVFDSIPLSFQWYKDSIAIVGATGSSYSVPNGQLGDYQVLASYDTLCVLSSPFVLDTTLITFNSITSGTCLFGNQTGEIIVANTNGGTTPYVYQLGNSGFVSDSMFRNLSAGIYSVTVQDSNGCEGIQTAVVDTFPAPQASFLADTVCLGQVTSFTNQSTISVGSIPSYQWSSPLNSSSQNTTFTFSSDGTFPITLTAVSDSGCADDTTISVLVNPLPVANFTFSPSELYTFNPEVCFTNQTIGASSYFWDFDFTGPTGTSNQENPCTILFPTNTAREYQITLIAETDLGCLDSASRFLSVLDEFLFYIPNAFSPNDDGINDELIVVSGGVESYSFTLFNRWGEIIFESTDTTEKWDGTFKGTKVPQGVYAYRAILQGQNGVVKEQIGHISLVR